MANCIRYDAFVASASSNYYLIVVCVKKRSMEVKKCIGVEVNDNSIRCLNSKAKVEFPFSLKGLDKTIEGSIQSYGNWLSKRMSEGKARLGYVEEMLIKYLAYMVCRVNGSIVKCLKTSDITTRRGKVGWKAVYQMFVNSKDLPKEETDVVKWVTPLPDECNQISSSASAFASA